MPTLGKSTKPWIPKRKKTNKSWSYDSRYHSSKWRKLRINFLKSNPLCKLCKEVGKTVAANVIDHIIPLSQNNSDDNFWNSNNHQALCAPCNNRKSQTDKAK